MEGSRWASGLRSFLVDGYATRTPIGTNFARSGSRGAAKLPNSQPARTDPNASELN